MQNTINNINLNQALPSAKTENASAFRANHTNKFERTPQTDSYDKKKSGKAVGITAGLILTAAALVAGVCYFKGKPVEGTKNFSERMSDGWKTFTGKFKKKAEGQVTAETEKVVKEKEVKILNEAEQLAKSEAEEINYFKKLMDGKETKEAIKKGEMKYDELLQENPLQEELNKLYAQRIKILRENIENVGDEAADIRESVLSNYIAKDILCNGTKSEELILNSETISKLKEALSKAESYDKVIDKNLPSGGRAYSNYLADIIYDYMHK